MEFVENGTLSSLLYGSVPISWADPLLRVATDVAEGLVYLHNLKYLHRDIKPENVLMTRTFGAKIADLGEARVKDISETMTQVGTPLYCKLGAMRDSLINGVYCDLIVLRLLNLRRFP